MIHLKLDYLIDQPGLLELKYEEFKFSGGEQHIKIDPRYVSKHPHDEEVLIEVSLVSADKLMQTLIATDALRRLGFGKISLFAPYLPYARQDRVCNKGEALSIKVLCDMINTQEYSAVFTLNNHSEVATALLNNCHEIDEAEIIKRNLGKLDIATLLVSPDAGALKKTHKLAKALGGLEVLECSKKRNVSNGEIIGTNVYGYEDLNNSHCLIVDDIVDGGRTFIELAKVLKERNAGNVDLYTSHGIYSKGLSIFDGLIKKIYTTKSFKNQFTNSLGWFFNLKDLGGYGGTSITTI